MGRRRTNNLDLPPRLYLKHGAYYYEQPNTRRWIRLSDNKAEALVKWAEYEGTDSHENPTVRELFARYLVNVAAKKAASTYAGNIQESKKLLEVFGGMYPDAITPHHVARYMELRGLNSPVRANREKALLSSVFAYAVRLGIVKTNPCRDVRGFKEKGRDRYITDAEFSAVLKLAGPKIGLMMRLAYLTAMRQQDLLALRLEQIDDDGIRITQGKTGKRQIFTWTPELRSIVDGALAMHPKLNQRPWLFPSRDGAGYTSDGFKSLWNRVQQQWAKQGGERFTWHDIRAKALTDAKRLGRDAQSLAGHATSAMTEHYIKAREIEEVSPLPEKAWGSEATKKQK